jgi:hypothetical protein
MAERFEVCRSGVWQDVPPGDICWGEKYRHYKDGVRLRRGDKILFLGPVEPVEDGHPDTSGVLVGADSEGRVEEPATEDEPIGDCIGIQCPHAMSGVVLEYGKVRFLKCALKNKPIMDLKVCPELKWRRNWKGEITIDGFKRI